MTKAEQKAANKFLIGMLKHRNKKLVSAKIFNKKAKVGQQLVVLPIKDIISQWKRFRKTVEK